MSHFALKSVVLSGALLTSLAVAPTAAQEACVAGTVAFESALLVKSPICVPEAPARAAFIDDLVMHALELGVPSVTTSHYSRIIIADFPGMAPLLDPATTTDIGNTWEMSGEALLGAQPDVVLTYKYWDAAIPYAEDIAPTLIVDDGKAKSWRDISRLVADLFGKQAEQAVLEADVDRRVALLRSALVAAGPAPSFSFSQVAGPTEIWSFTTEAFGAAFAVEAGMVLGDGIPTPEESAKLPDGGTVAFPVSLENLDLLDADHVFFYANQGSDAEEMVKDNEIFQRFAAARPGRVHFITGEYWFRAGATSGQRIIDDLYRAVLGQDPAVVSPNPLAWAYDGSSRP